MKYRLFGIDSEALLFDLRKVVLMPILFDFVPDQHRMIVFVERGGWIKNITVH